jgi:hypothetical protein
MALTAWSRTAASNTNAATGVNFDEGQAPSTVNNSARELQSQIVIGIQDSTLLYLTSVSGVDTITATAAASMSAYATGQKFHFIAAGANTGAVTLNINSIGAKAVTKYGTTALVSGDLVSGATYCIIYDGTRFQIVGDTAVLTGKTLTSPVINSATGVGQTIVKRKTADESVTSSSALQDDDHLTFAIGANEEWQAILSIVAGDNVAVPGIQTAVTVPSGATMLASAKYLFDPDSPRSSHSATSGGVILGIQPPTSSFAYIYIDIWVLNGSNAGNVTLQWSQFVSNITSLKFKKGATLVAHRIA